MPFYNIINYLTQFILWKIKNEHVIYEIKKNNLFKNKLERFYRSLHYFFLIK